MTPDYQVVVAGGGPAGAAAALELARLGRRVVLVDATAGDEFRVGEAVPPAARPLLRDLGVLARFLTDGHLPCFGNVSVWGGTEPAATDFIFDPNGHGWHLDRARFDAMFRDAAGGTGANVLPATRVSGVDREGDTGWRVTLTTGENRSVDVRCRWLIDATGRRSTVAGRVGERRVREDNLVAFYARYWAGMGTGVDRDSRTVIEAGPDGWWYSALVPAGERVVAFLTDADLIDCRAALSPEGFAASLGTSEFIRAILAAHRYEMASSPRGADAATARLARVTGPGWAAVGDAAVSFDPLSSQGILTALFTGMQAARAVDRALADDLTGLDEYARQVDEIDRIYRRNRTVYYATEGRWPDRPFWHRRRPAAGRPSGPEEKP